jgi:hypothetical protein
MEKNNLSGSDSIRIIEQMIGRAKQEEKDSGRGWIIWGWMLFLASIINYVMILVAAPKPYFVWVIFGIASMVFVLFSMIRKRFFFKGAAGVKTYTNELVDKMGAAFFISLVIMVIGNDLTGLNSTGVNFAYLLLLYGFWMYIHASAFRFNLLRAGAFINWAGAIIIFIFYKEMGKNILLVHAACVALGYIIPGHIAQQRFGSATKDQDKSQPS